MNFTIQQPVPRYDFKKKVDKEHPIKEVPEFVPEFHATRRNQVIVTWFLNHQVATSTCRIATWIRGWGGGCDLWIVSHRLQFPLRSQGCKLLPASKLRSFTAESSQSLPFPMFQVIETTSITAAVLDVYHFPPTSSFLDEEKTYIALEVSLSTDRNHRSYDVSSTSETHWRLSHSSFKGMHDYHPRNIPSSTESWPSHCLELEVCSDGHDLREAINLRRSVVNAAECRWLKPKRKKKKKENTNTVNHAVFS